VRETIRDLLSVAIEAVNPARLTKLALERDIPATRSVIAIGKAAPGMVRGAYEALGPIDGVCVSAEPAVVPHGVEVMVGDHPVPGEASFEAGRKALRTASESEDGCVVLVSGGGSSLCEWPRPGVERPWLREVYERLLLAGTSIRDTNIVRGHLSAIKCGGLARAGTGPYPTYILSDVAGEGPEIVASGPTLPMANDPELARKILEEIGVEIGAPAWHAMTLEADGQVGTTQVTVIGDGLTAARAIADRASDLRIEARIHDGWLTGEPESAIDDFLSASASGLTIAAGETTVRVGSTHGNGGRNTHASLLAAERISGTDWLFGAFATDGVDGSTGAAGAIVDGGTVDRGGDPSRSVDQFDSATYLGRSGDLVVTGPTGTNVADLWVLWRP
jgi:glycerate 2-kinase